MGNEKIQEEVEKVIELLKKYFSGKRKTTLNRMKHQDPFKILIACLLSLRTKDEITEEVSERLFSVADTPEKILSMPTEKLEKIIYRVGYYRKKAKVLKHVSKVIVEKFNSRVPDKKEELLKIKGVGQKTANIVLNFAFSKDTLPIDTHCHRIPNRIGWIKTRTPEQSEKELERIVPKKYWKEFNGLFILFGRTICLPVSPLCSKCPIRNYCKRIGVKRSR